MMSGRGPYQAPAASDANSWRNKVAGAAPAAPRPAPPSSEAPATPAPSLDNGANTKPPAEINERMSFVHQVLVGYPVQVQLTDESQFEGIFSTPTWDAQGLSYVLRMCKQVRAAKGAENHVRKPDASRAFRSGTVVQLVASHVRIGARDVGPLDLDDAGGFGTDAAISRGRGGLVGRELQAWVPDHVDNDLPAGVDLSRGLEDSGAGGWDQFTVNKAKFGVETSWDENLYTTKLDPKLAGISEAEAARIAREIERSGAGNNAHVAEERGQEVDMGDMDEEDRYGAVIREGSQGGAAGQRAKPAPRGPPPVKAWGNPSSTLSILGVPGGPMGPPGVQGRGRGAPPTVVAMAPRPGMPPQMAGVQPVMVPAQRPPPSVIPIRPASTSSTPPPVESAPAPAPAPAPVAVAAVAVPAASAPAADGAPGADAPKAEEKPKSKFKFNVAAKEFKFNVGAKEFVPSFKPEDKPAADEPSKKTADAASAGPNPLINARPESGASASASSFNPAYRDAPGGSLYQGAMNSPKHGPAGSAGSGSGRGGAYPPGNNGSEQRSPKVGNKTSPMQQPHMPLPQPGMMPPGPLPAGMMPPGMPGMPMYPGMMPPGMPPMMHAGPYMIAAPAHLVNMQANRMGPQYYAVPPMPYVPQISMPNSPGGARQGMYGAGVPPPPQFHQGPPPGAGGGREQHGQHGPQQGPGPEGNLHSKGPSSSEQQGMGGN